MNDQYADRIERDGFYLALPGVVHHPMLHQSIFGSKEKTTRTPASHEQV
jgi:hypothetical protein